MFFFDRFFGAGCWDAGHLSGGCRVSLGAPCEALECREHQGTVEPRAWGPRGKEIDVDIKPITDEAHDLAHDLAHHAFGLTVWSWVELGGAGWSWVGRLLDTGF